MLGCSSLYWYVGATGGLWVVAVGEEGGRIGKAIKMYAYCFSYTQTHTNMSHVVTSICLRMSHANYGTDNFPARAYALSMGLSANPISIYSSSLPPLILPTKSSRAFCAHVCANACVCAHSPVLYVSGMPAGYYNARVIIHKSHVCVCVCIIHKSSTHIQPQFMWSQALLRAT